MFIYDLLHYLLYLEAIFILYIDRNIILMISHQLKAIKIFFARHTIILLIFLLYICYLLFIKSKFVRPLF